MTSEVQSLMKDIRQTRVWGKTRFGRFWFFRTLVMVVGAYMTMWLVTYDEVLSQYPTSTSFILGVITGYGLRTIDEGWK